ncbi:hypothetical protein [Ruegeria arenilitoris]|uniref:hypothetical protein n=1 Tax=Ruegeria arenilitoris TaxID=1173585 RepID=UPI00147D1DE2|nr:hypothetical protein [Ruegeria arenilitoris]
MTKASGQRTRPEVAKKGAVQAPGIYDFVQSPEWQKVLEKARIEQERNHAAREQKDKKTEASETADRGGAQSTSGEPSPVGQKAWSDQLEEARKKRNAAGAGGTGESEKIGPDAPDGVQKADTGENARGTFRSRRGKNRSTGSDQTDAGLSLKLSNEEIDYRLSKKILQKLEDQQRARRKVRLGLIALGCAMGVIASSSVFWVLSGPGPIETAGQGSTDVEVATPLLGQDVVPLPPDLSTTPQGEIVISTTVVGPSTQQEFPDGSLGEVDDLSSLASLMPPASGLTEASEPTEPAIPDAAPSVLAYVPALEQPFLPVGGPGYLPTREANPSFLPYDIAPEFFDPATALVAVSAAGLEPLGIAAEAFIPPVPSAELAAQTVLFRQPAPLSPAAETGSLPEQVPAIQPDLPVSINPVDSALTIVALNPSAQIEDPGIGPEALQAPTLTPRAEPSDSVALAALPGAAVEPTETSTGAGGAAFRLYAPNKLPQGAVDSVVASLTTTGHELSGAARVGYRVSQSNVRFYHRQDAAKAAALAKDAGALLRDFTGARTKTPSGVVELYLAGDGYGSAPVKRKAKRSSRSATANNPVNQLRSQVLKKLRATTN